MHQRPAAAGLCACLPLRRAVRLFVSASVCSLDMCISHFSHFHRISSLRPAFFCPCCARSSTDSAGILRRASLFVCLCSCVYCGQRWKGFGALSCPSFHSARAWVLGRRAFLCVPFRCPRSPSPPSPSPAGAAPPLAGSLLLCWWHNTPSGRLSCRLTDERSFFYSALFLRGCCSLFFRPCLALALFLCA